jgi:hypothetical protein
MVSVHLQACSIRCLTALHRCFIGPRVEAALLSAELEAGDGCPIRGEQLAMYLSSWRGTPI